MTTRMSIMESNVARDALQECLLQMQRDYIASMAGIGDALIDGIAEASTHRALGIESSSAIEGQFSVISEEPTSAS